jgi:hypothetical protein
MEHWKPIRDYEELYEVSNLGNVRRILKYRNSKDACLKPGVATGGYHQVSLCRENKKNQRLVHRMVAEAFIGIPDGMVINHKNGIKSDNRLANLEVVTRSENERHKWDVLGIKIRNLAKLTQSDADSIRLLRTSGMTLKAIAAQYGVSLSNIHYVVTYKTWFR